MNHMSTSNGRVFLKGLLFGGLLGAGIALFGAPRSGEETREMIRQRAMAWQGKAEHLVDEAQAKGDQVAEEVVERSAELHARGATVLHEGQEHLHKAVEETIKAVDIVSKV